MGTFSVIGLIVNIMMALELRKLIDYQIVPFLHIVVNLNKESKAYLRSDALNSFW